MATGSSTNRVAKLRRMQTLRLQDVANELGVSATTVNRWERGEIGIPDHHKLSLARLFHVSVVFLMGWEDQDNGNGNGGQHKEKAA